MSMLDIKERIRTIHHISYDSVNVTNNHGGMDYSYLIHHLCFVALLHLPTIH